jgi:hypothetical protein
MNDFACLTKDLEAQGAGPMSAKINSAILAISDVLGSCKMDDEAYKRLIIARSGLADAAILAVNLERISILDRERVAAINPQEAAA